MRKQTIILAFLFTLSAHAHIGSPDTFVQAQTGPYKFLLAAHPPATYPGALELDLRFNPDDHITAATAALDSSVSTPIHIFDAGTATTSLWLPNAAAHTIHITVQGSTYDLALPASTQTTQPPTYSWWHSTLLILCIALMAGAVVLGIRNRKYLGYSAFTASAGLLLYLIPAHHTQAPPPITTLTASLSPNGVLDFTLTNPAETFSDLTPDHGKLIHLFLIRQPQQDVFLHLHPQQTSPGHFSVPLPAMPPGTYQLFADFYHSSGSGETPTLTLTLPAQFHPASTPDPDDSIAILPPSTQSVSSFSPTAQLAVISLSDSSGMTTSTAHLLDNYAIQLRSPTNLQPLRASLFQVTLLDAQGHPPSDMALYLGMPAHAVVLRSDNSVFAHIHPGGTLPMLASSTSHSMTMPMDMPMRAPSNSTEIPYGFPSAGRYRLFIQMKHASIVETAAFDLNVR